MIDFKFLSEVLLSVKLVIEMECFLMDFFMLGEMKILIECWCVVGLLDEGGNFYCEISEIIGVSMIIVICVLCFLS